MRRESHHLTYIERQKIEALSKAGHTQAQIAAFLGRSRSTICRELRRGQVDQLDGDRYVFYRAYSADKAQLDANERMTAKGAPLKIGHDYALVEHIERKIIQDRYSPRAVLDEIDQQRLPFQTRISEKTLYNYLDSGLFLHLKRKHLPRERYNKHKKKTAPKRAAFANILKPSIEDRRALINTRLQFGHWEMDTVVGKRKGKNAVLLVLTERLTRYEVVRKIHRKQAKYVTRAIDGLERQCGDKFGRIFKSITVDNGCEFADYAGLTKHDRVKVYYCHPYSSWERGSNENCNAMIRRWVPKGLNISKVTHKQVQFVQDWLNDYPRRILGATARTAFEQELQKLGLCP